MVALILLFFFQLFIENAKGRNCSTHRDIELSSHKEICIMMLLNEGPATINNTLNSYEASGFLSSSYIKQKFAFLNQYKGDQYDQDRESLMKKYNFTILSSPINEVFASIIPVMEQCSSDFFLFLEEDFKIAESVDVNFELRNAMEVLDSGYAQAVRMRHRTNPGDPDFLCDRYRYKKQKALLPQILHHPDCRFRYGENDTDLCTLWKCHPEMSCMNSLEYDQYYLQNSTNPPKFVPFTNNPMLYHTSWYRKHIVDEFLKKGKTTINGGKNAMESSIEASDLWKKYPGVTIARGTGLFTHHRIDRGRIYPEPTRARGPPLRIDRGRKHPGAPRARGAYLGIDRERKIN